LARTSLTLLLELVAGAVVAGAAASEEACLKKSLM